MAVMLPRVVCICPTRDRPQFLHRARRCFESQTYPNKRLYVLKTGFPPFAFMTIGNLRNTMCHAATDADIIAHWDDDDWSYPGRLADQVALLTPQVDCVGYRDMLFWNGEAWHYQHPEPDFCIGTSMMYWRRTWQWKAFRDTSEGEDNYFQQGLTTRSLPGILRGQPNMIAEIHGRNTWGKIDPTTNEFSRTPQWDQVCRTTLGYDKT